MILNEFPMLSLEVRVLTEKFNLLFTFVMACLEFLMWSMKSLMSLMPSIYYFF